jgi:hypothetical protein
VFSSSVDFPPLVSLAQSLKLLLASMQGLVSIRLLAVSWPPIVLQMLDFARYFTFNFEAIRPECTVNYSPQTKLVFTLIGPAACALFILALVFLYFAFKCNRISIMLQRDDVKSVHNKSFRETALSVAQCLLTTVFCLKFSASRMMVDGAFWNALSPTLAKRTNTFVLQQKMRRRTVTAQASMHDGANTNFGTWALPEDWIRMQAAVASIPVQYEFARSAKRIRLLVSSALSIFIFTFQGSIESAISTFHCSSVDGVPFLRSNPTIKCRLDDDVYSGMVVTAAIGLTMYCLLLPAAIVISLRSRWCRQIYVHDSMAYSHMFAFLTSMHTKSYPLWELVTCARKVAFVCIPVLVSKNTLLQSVALFSFLVVNALITLRMRPMASSILNQIEAISSIVFIVGSFASIFFVVEYQGSQVLSGDSRDLAGMALVIVCGICALLSAKLVWNDCSSRPQCPSNAAIFRFLSCG